MPARHSPWFHRKLLLHLIPPTKSPNWSHCPLPQGNSVLPDCSPVPPLLSVPPRKLQTEAHELSLWTRTQRTVWKEIRPHLPALPLPPVHPSHRMSKAESECAQTISPESVWRSQSHSFQACSSPAKSYDKDSPAHRHRKSAESPPHYYKTHPQKQAYPP